MGRWKKEREQERETESVCERERERERERVLGKEEGLGGREVRKRGEKKAQLRKTALSKGGHGQGWGRGQRGCPGLKDNTTTHRSAAFTLGGGTRAEESRAPWGRRDKAGSVL